MRLLMKIRQCNMKMCEFGNKNKLECSEGKARGIRSH